MDPKLQTSFFLRHLRMLPSAYQSADNQRMTLGFFCLSALDLIGALDEKVKSDERADLIDWIYEQQIAGDGGFRGSPCLGQPDASSSSGCFTTGAGGHLAMTYTAILMLGILGDDFARMDMRGLARLLQACQQPDGSFLAGPDQVEQDVRFTFCAFAVAAMTDSWSHINIDAALGFLQRCQSYEGAYGQAPEQEAHGGSTYCAVAAYTLAGRQPEIRRKQDLVRWLLSRQQAGTGFNGRPQKPVDTCYSFWCGAALEMLGVHASLDGASDTHWLLSNETKIGGFSKTCADAPDAMHSYLSIAALAMHAAEGVRAFDPSLNASQDAIKRIREKARKRPDG